MPNVATANQFVDALKNMTSNSVITLTADIDFNNWIPDAGQTYPIACPSSQTNVSDVIIEGGGHNVYNLNNTNSLFSTYLTATSLGGLRINHVNFINSACFNRNNFIFATSGTPAINTHKLTFYQCTFHGTFNSGFANGRAVYYEKCTFSITSNSGDLSYVSSNNTPDYFQCYFDLKNVRKSVTAPSLSNLNSCYVQGKIIIPDDLTSSAQYYTICRNIGNCCINFDLTIPDEIDISLSNLVQHDTSSSKISVVNTDKITGATPSSNANIVGVTDVEMHDAQALFDVGFEIIV